MTSDATPMSAEHRADIDSMIYHPIGLPASLLDGNDAVHLWHELRRVETERDDLRRHLEAARTALEHLADGDQCRECRALNPDVLGTEDYYRLMGIHDERIAIEALAGFLVIATYLNEPSELSKRLNPQT